MKTLCTLSHKYKQGGADKQGPNLHGLFGRISGTKAGYSYSKANQNAAVEWGEIGKSKQMRFGGKIQMYFWKT